MPRSISLRCGFPLLFCPTPPLQSISSLVTLSSYLFLSTCLLLPHVFPLVPLLPHLRPTVAFVSATFSFLLHPSCSPAVTPLAFLSHHLSFTIVHFGAFPSPTLQPPKQSRPWSSPIDMNASHLCSFLSGRIDRDHELLLSRSLGSTCVLAWVSGRRRRWRRRTHSISTRPRQLQTSFRDRNAKHTRRRTDVNHDVVVIVPETPADMAESEVNAKVRHDEPTRNDDVLGHVQQACEGAAGARSEWKQTC